MKIRSVIKNLKAKKDRRYYEHLLAKGLISINTFKQIAPLPDGIKTIEREAIDTFVGCFNGAKVMAIHHKPKTIFDIMRGSTLEPSRIAPTLSIKGRPRKLSLHMDTVTVEQAELSYLSGKALTVNDGRHVTLI
jgi:hypothetical protein